MVQIGQRAPDFTAPLADGEYGSFTLSDAVGDGYLVLAFFPAAFSQVCSAEMDEFQERLDAFRDGNASVYGVSVDTPSALNAFRDELDLQFDMISDNEKKIIDEYDVAMDFDAIGVENIARRAVFVIDEDREVVYRWVSEEVGSHPDYGTVVAEATAE